MYTIENSKRYWEAAGPAVTLAVERQLYFKNLVKLLSAVPPDDFTYLLSLELCRWIDTGETIESFIEWISAYNNGRVETKWLLLEKLKPGSSLRFCSAQVELAGMLESVCNEYDDKEGTSGWRLMKFMLENSVIVNLSTCLYNGFKKGFALYLAIHFSDCLETICNSRLALSLFQSVYEESVYGIQINIHTATDKSVGISNSQFINPEEDPVIKGKVRRVVLLYFYQKRQQYFEKEKGTIAKLSGFNVKSLERQWRNWANEAGIQGVSRRRELIEDIEAVSKYLTDEQKNTANEHLKYIRNKK